MYLRGLIPRDIIKDEIIEKELFQNPLIFVLSVLSTETQQLYESYAAPDENYIYYLFDLGRSVQTKRSQIKHQGSRPTEVRVRRVLRGFLHHHRPHHCWVPAQRGGGVSGGVSATGGVCGLHLVPGTVLPPQLLWPAYHLSLLCQVTTSTTTSTTMLFAMLSVQWTRSPQ